LLLGAVQYSTETPWLAARCIKNASAAFLARQRNLIKFGAVHIAGAQRWRLSLAFRPFVADRQAHAAKDDGIRFRPCNTIRDSARVD
jgi:hypothetical protein